MRKNISDKIKTKNQINNNYQQKKINVNQTNFYEIPKYNSVNFNSNNISPNPNLNKNNFNNNMINPNFANNLQNDYNIPESLESSISTKINEKNIALLNDRIKKQENDIIYLNNRLKNYDECVDQITKLNLEINQLNEIINNKNNTIQEFRTITDLSKNKIEELINNKKEMDKKINFLENENKKLNNLNKYENKNNNYNYVDRKNDFDNIKIEEYNKLKNDFNEIVEENKKLKNIINEKDEQIKYLNKLIEKFNKEKNDINNNNKIIYEIINDTKLREPSIKSNNLKRININSKRTYSIQGRSPTPITTNIYNGRYDIIPKKDYFRKDYSFRTEPNNALYNSNNHSKKIIYNFKNKYNYLQNKYRVNPLDYSNYLLDNLQDNISHHYNV